MVSIDEGLEIIKWFTNHSRALGLLKSQQETTEFFRKHKRVITLILPVISRWTVHFLSTRRLLLWSPPMRSLYLQDFNTLIECAGAKAASKEKAREVLAPIEQPVFWQNLAK